MIRFALSALLLSASSAAAADWPQWGGGPTRNPVSAEKGLPLDFQFELADDGFVGGDKRIRKERGITWKAELGPRSLVPPVVADGLVWIVTRTSPPAGDPDAAPEKWDRAVLKCLRESDGKLVWEYTTPWLKPGHKSWQDVVGTCPLAEGDRLWYVNARSHVVCLDIAPLKKGTGKPVALWERDLLKDFGVVPFFPVCPPVFAGLAASVAGHKGRLYVVTNNAKEWSTSVPAPDAPSLVCFDKATGETVWKDNSPGKNVLEYQTSSPLVAEVNGKAQVIVGQGDGWLRAFDAATGKLVWKCDLNTKDAVWEIGGTRNYVMATPILYDGRVYAAIGQHGTLMPGPGALYCVDPTKAGDVSRELDAGPGKGKPNPNSAVVWYTPKDVPEDAPRIELGKKKKRDLLRDRGYYFGRSIAGCVARDGLLYAADVDGLLFCFDAKTGKLYWATDLREQVTGQLLWADGTVLAATYSGAVVALAHGKEHKQLARIEAPDGCIPGPVFANSTLYLTTRDTLYAIRKEK